MPYSLILLPLLAAALAALVPWNRSRPWLLPAAACAHSAMTLAALSHAGPLAGAPWLVLDPVSRIVLLLVSTLFLACACYATGHMLRRPDQPNRILTTCMLASLGMMTLVIGSHHLGLMWVAIEATTLATAPLIDFNRTQRSIEATWKYLLIGSVGIALALLGTFFLAYASLHEGLWSTLFLEDLLERAPTLSRPWLHAAFILLLVGFGTKMGLAPMHTWKPDAYGEAPAVVGGMLASCVTSCAFLALLRSYQICIAAGEGAFASGLLLPVGLFSMAVAGVFIAVQRDLLRMLAYSSVEHMGILVVGLGIGGPALFGTLLHVMTNGLTKGALFLSAGNVHLACGGKGPELVRGAVRRLPLSGSILLAAFLAITGSPPFGPFVSEFAILNGAFDTDRFLAGGLFLALLLLVFIGMGAAVLSASLGSVPAAARATDYRDGLLTGAPAAVLIVAVLVLGLVIPRPLHDMLTEAVRYLAAPT